MPSLYVRLIGSTLPSDISMLAQFTMRFMRFRFTMQLLWHWAKQAELLPIKNGGTVTYLLSLIHI